jgi:hypothetical protein
MIGFVKLGFPLVQRFEIAASVDARHTRDS